MALVDDRLSAAPYAFRVGTPREPARRGGHVALERDAGAAAVCRALIARGIVPDFRPPNVIRVCPAPLYGTFHELWRTVEELRAIIDAGEHRGG
jgi:kynureninase